MIARALILSTLFYVNEIVSQKNPSNYYWPRTDVEPGFYTTYGDLLKGQPLHRGPFKIEHKKIRCGYRQTCDSYDLIISSKVKAEIFPLNVNYLYDGNDLYVIYRTTPLAFGTHIEADQVWNKGRFCYFVRLESRNGIVSEVPFIVDLETDSKFKPSKKNLKNILFKDHPGLYEEYKSDPQPGKMTKYLNLLNKQLLSETK